VLAAWVFAGTMGMLIVPKLLALIVIARDRKTRREFGGSAKMFSGIVAETILSGLTAPIMMIFQSSAVAEILFGRDAGWQVQRRDNGAISPREVVRIYSVPTAMGVAMMAAAYAVSLPLLLWMMPVILGLLLSIPIAILSSSVKPTHRPALFQTPEQANPPWVLARANELAGAPHARLTNPLLELRRDDRLLEAHLNSLEQRTRRRGDIDPHLAIARAKIEDAETIEEASMFLTSREMFALLNAIRPLKAALSLPSQEAKPGTSGIALK
jgi:membrane glycosyltransferase